MIHLRTLILLLILTGCAAPKNSYKRFPEPKYKVRTHARDGVPSVAQTWWSHLWFWENWGNKKQGKSIRLR